MSHTIRAISSASFQTTNTPKGQKINFYLGFSSLQKQRRVDERIVESEISPFVEESSDEDVHLLRPFLDEAM